VKKNQKTTMNMTQSIRVSGLYAWKILALK